MSYSETHSIARPPSSSLVGWAQVIYALHAVSILPRVLGAATMLAAFPIGWPSTLRDRTPPLAAWGAFPRHHRLRLCPELSASRPGIAHDERVARCGGVLMGPRVNRYTANIAGASLRAAAIAVRRTRGE
jgi:hypothetical protein